MAGYIYMVEFASEKTERLSREQRWSWMLVSAKLSENQQKWMVWLWQWLLRLYSSRVFVWKCLQYIVYISANKYKHALTLFSFFYGNKSK